MNKALFFIENTPLKQYLKAIFETKFEIEESTDIKRLLSKDEIFSYSAIVIGKNYGLLSKMKLCEAIADFAIENNHKILIFLLKTPQDKLQKRYKDIFIINIPTIHETLSKIINENEVKTLSERHFKETTKKNKNQEIELYSFFRSIKDNQKITILSFDKQLEFLVADKKLIILKNEFNTLSDLFLNTKVNVVYHDFNTNNFTMRVADDRFKQISLKQFIKEGLQNILDEKHLYKLLPKNKTKIFVKANLYTLKDLLPDDSVININWLHKQTEVDINDVLERFGTVKSLRDIVIMYFAKAIDLVSAEYPDQNFGINLPLQVLNKITQKIQNL
jgi:D-ribose pyranose/furanose isomerase RbsD